MVKILCFGIANLIFQLQPAAAAAVSIVSISLLKLRMREIMFHRHQERRLSTAVNRATSQLFDITFFFATEPAGNNRPSGELKGILDL